MVWWLRVSWPSPRWCREGTRLSLCLMSSIPDRIHMVWIGSRPFPHADYLEAWETAHVHWEVIFWDEGALRAERLDCQPIVDEIRHHAGKVNLIRLELARKSTRLNSSHGLIS